MSRMLMFLGSVVALQKLTLDDFSGIINLLHETTYKKRTDMQARNEF